MFMAVRHPFDRLVSAFRDKIERSGGHDADYYYKLYGKSIVSQYRSKALKVLGPDFFNASNNFGAMFPVNGYRNASYPCFYEFVQAVIDGFISMDEHWYPSFSYCSVCHPSVKSKLKYVLKFENLQTEVPKLLEQIGRIDLLENATNVNKPERISTMELRKKYFAQLSDSDVKKLKEIYKEDFLAFGYSFDTN